MIKLKDFWETSMTSLRRVLNNEVIDSNFVMERGEEEVTAFFPNITTCEIMVSLAGDEDEEEESEETYY